MAFNSAHVYAASARSQRLRSKTAKVLSSAFNFHLNDNFINQTMQQATTSTKLGEEPNRLDSTGRYLCEKCLDIFTHWYLRTNDGDSLLTTRPHHSIDDLIISARKSCPLCRHFLDTLSTADISKIRARRGQKQSCVAYYHPELNYVPEFDDETCTLVLDFDFDNKKKQDLLPNPCVDVVDARCKIIYLFGSSRVNYPPSRFRPIHPDVNNRSYYRLRVDLDQSRAMDRMVRARRT